MSEFKQNNYFLSADDKWIIQLILNTLYKRICSEHADQPNIRNGLFRFFLALQRLPSKTKGISLSIEVCCYQLEINSELFGLNVYTDDGHTTFRLQYFDKSKHCISGYDFLTGNEMEESLRFHLSEVGELMVNEKVIHIEDLSVGTEVDSMTINHQEVAIESVGGGYSN